MEKIALLMMMMMVMWKSFFLPHVHSMMLFNLSFFLVSFHFHLFFFSSSDTSNKIFIGNKQTEKTKTVISFSSVCWFLGKKKFWIFSWILGVQVYNKCMCFYFEMWMNLFLFVIISNYNSFKLDEQNFQWFCLDEIFFHNLSPSLLLLLFDYNMASCLI